VCVKRVSQRLKDLSNAVIHSVDTGRIGVNDANQDPQKQPQGKLLDARS
jgi:hypothetical protein